MLAHFCLQSVHWLASSTIRKGGCSGKSQNSSPAAGMLHESEDTFLTETLYDSHTERLSKERLQGGKCGNITSCVCLHARLLLTLL